MVKRKPTTNKKQLSKAARRLSRGKASKVQAPNGFGGINPLSGSTFKRKPRRPRTRRVRGGRAPMPPHGFSQGAIRYAALLQDPFSMPAAHTPAPPAQLSLPAKVWAKGVLSTGSAGFGFITLEPTFGAFSDPITVSAVPTFFVAISTAAYAGTTISYTAAGVSQVPNNSTYLFAQYGSTAGLNQYRVTAAGIRTRYIGTENNRGGQMLGFLDPNHASVLGRGFSAIDGESTSIREPVNREWCSVIWKPSEVLDNTFIGTFPNTSATTYPMGICIQDATGGVTPLAYEFEAFVSLEHSGRNIRGKYLSPADPAGYSAVQMAAQTAHTQVHMGNDLYTKIPVLLEEAHGHLANQSDPGIASKIFSGIGNSLKKIPWGAIAEDAVDGLVEGIGMLAAAA